VFVHNPIQKDLGLRHLVMNVEHIHDVAELVAESVDAAKYEGLLWLWPYTQHPYREVPN
jgi:hypothetical protein